MFNKSNKFCFHFRFDPGQTVGTKWVRWVAVLLMITWDRKIKFRYSLLRELDAFHGVDTIDSFI